MLKIISYPIAALWRFIISTRRKLYNKNKRFKRVSFEKPIICVGNLSFGGTGKTPHVEYLISLLESKYSIAVLSRGYKRKTKGFVLADSVSDNSTIGDEPLLYYKKYPSVVVAVDEDRVEGVSKIYEKLPEIDVVLLDDAYQHLPIKAGLNILLTDYKNIYSKDFVFPSGSLREPASAAKEADIIVITKSPIVVSPLEEQFFLKELKPLPHQRIYFSYVKYGQLLPFTDVAKEQQEPPKSIVLLIGIANPTPLVLHMKELYKDIQVASFKDHHLFTADEIKRLKNMMNKSLYKSSAIVTTEKDAMRLFDPSIRHLIQDLPIYYVPIKVEFHSKYKSEFDKDILDYVATDK